MKRFFCLLLLATLSCAAECGVSSRHIHGNYSYELAGNPDARPYHWGTVEAQVAPLRFTPPPHGQRIRILAINGDIIAWRTTMGQGPASTPEGNHVGVLAAVMRHPGSRGSDYADLAADDHFAYKQAVIGSTGVAQAEFDPAFPLDDENAVLHTPESLAIEALRGGDMGAAEPHTLYFKAAKFLDDTGYVTHVEVTWNVRFCYEGVE